MYSSKIFCEIYIIVCYFIQRTWMSLLTTKFKYERQKLNNDAEVQACRRKFASKRRLAVNDDDQADNGGTAERCRRVDVSKAHWIYVDTVKQTVCFFYYALHMHIIISVKWLSVVLHPCILILSLTTEPRLRLQSVG